jgi:quinolinate synthase
MIDVLKQRDIETVDFSQEDLMKEINRLRKKRNAIILAHFYQEAEIQDIADFVGDSLQLSQQAKKTSADVIVFAGVHFMAETAKILSPQKTVLLPDLEAGCSLADSCNAVDFERFLKNYPGHTVISYVNTTAEIKALTDIICTSSNALEIVKSLPADEKIVFAPDKNLGNYIKSVTGRDMVIWDGACHVHERFSLEKIIELKKENPQAKIISHPECEKPILLISDFVGSTSALLNYTKSDHNNAYIVCTESGILHQMRKAHPEKEFIPGPPNDSTCACNDCQFMKLITLKKIYLSLKNNRFEIKLNEDIIRKAERPIIRMLEISEKLGIK